MATRIGLDDMRGFKNKYQRELLEGERILAEVLAVPGVVSANIEYVVRDQVFEVSIKTATTSAWRQEFQPAPNESVAEWVSRMLGEP